MDHFLNQNVLERPALRFLALFDGLGTAFYILQSLAIEVEAYFSSEIDLKANTLLRYKYHDKIIMLGDVRSIRGEKLRSLGRIDLLVGGSPCNDLSSANPSRKRMTGKVILSWQPP